MMLHHFGSNCCASRDLIAAVTAALAWRHAGSSGPAALTWAFVAWNLRTRAVKAMRMLVLSFRMKRASGAFMSARRCFLRWSRLATLCALVQVRRDSPTVSGDVRWHGKRGRQTPKEKVSSGTRGGTSASLSRLRDRSPQSDWDIDAPSLASTKTKVSFGQQTPETALVSYAHDDIASPPLEASVIQLGLPETTAQTQPKGFISGSTTCSGDDLPCRASRIKPGTLYRIHSREPLGITSISASWAVLAQAENFLKSSRIIDQYPSNSSRAGLGNPMNNSFGHGQPSMCRKQSPHKRLADALRADNATRRAQQRDKYISLQLQRYRAP